MSEFMICDLLITIKKGNKFLYIFFFKEKDYYRSFLYFCFLPGGKDCVT